MVLFSVFVAITILWVMIAKVALHRVYSWGEMGLQFGISLVCAALVSLLTNFTSFTDYKVVHGRVVNKEAIERQCDTSWSDWEDSFCTNQDTRRVVDTCKKDEDGRRVCTYKTQYRSIYSWERKYFVYTSVADYQIRREDKQGVIYPKRYDVVEVGEPVATVVPYTNYIKAAPQTLLRNNVDSGRVTPPIAFIHDYYKVDQVYGIRDAATSEDWSRKLQELNSVLSDSKLDVSVSLFVTNDSQVWANDLQVQRHGHAFNTISVVIGMKGDDIAWVDVRSWAKFDIVNSEIRDSIYAIKKLDIDKILSLLEEKVSLYYKPSDMEDYSYLQDDIQIETWKLILAVILLLALNVGITVAFAHNED